MGCGMQGQRCCDPSAFTYSGAFAVDFGIRGAPSLPPPSPPPFSAKGWRAPRGTRASPWQKRGRGGGEIWATKCWPLPLKEMCKDRFVHSRLGGVFLRSGSLLGCGMQGGRCCGPFFYIFRRVCCRLWNLGRALSALPLPSPRAGARPGVPAPALGRKEGGEGGNLGHRTLATSPQRDV